MSKSFTFKQFHIDAEQCGMPVSTDGVMLGAWSNIDNKPSILDIGCGSGLLTIMCAQRNLNARIVGIDIESNAINAANKNSKNCPWHDRIDILQIPLQEFVNTKQRFSAIICNPPYFNNGETSKDPQRSVARHTSTLSYYTLLTSCERLLEEGGAVSLILPQVEGEVFLELLNELIEQEDLKLSISRNTLVRTLFNKDPTRMLLELTKNSSELVIEFQQETLTINEQNGVYSENYIKLTKAFYLKM